MEEHFVVAPTKRRRHSQEFKAQVLNACKQAGVSVAAVALQHQLNANLLRRWIVAQHQENKPIQAGKPETVGSTPFVPLQLPPPSAATQEIVVDVQRGDTTVKIHWPSSMAADCATWLHGWMR